MTLLLIIIDSLLFAIRGLVPNQGVKVLLDFLFWFVFLLIITGIAATVLK